jgi:hypothetical protein
MVGYHSRYQNAAKKASKRLEARQLHGKHGMEWLTWFPSFHWQQTALGVAMLVLVIAMLMAVRPRAPWSRRKSI